MAKTLVITMSKTWHPPKNLLFEYSHLTGTLNDKSFILTPENPEELADNKQVPDDILYSKEMKLYISKPGKIISFSLLNEKGFFRRTGPDAITGKLLMQQTVDEMAELQISITVKITISGNKSQVRKNIFLNTKNMKH